MRKLFFIAATWTFGSILFAQGTAPSQAPTPISSPVVEMTPATSPTAQISATPAALSPPLSPTLSTADSNTLFQASVAAYKKHSLDEARQLFTQFLNKAASSEGFYDLGLVEYESKNIGAAVALWRRALELDPHNQLANDSLNFIQKRIEHPELNRQNDSFEILRERVLNRTQVEYLFLLTAFIFATFFWLLFSYLGEKKRSREQELAAPPIPWVAGILFCLLILSTVISSAKLYDLTILRATVLPTKISVLSAPDAESTQLFELFEGLEVIVEASQGDYLQVTFPGGMTGWTLKKNLMLTRGRDT